MLGTQTTYPDFVPNQILTNSQLNDLRQHLDDQDRITRRKLVGMGLICGFRWKLKGPQAARKVELSEGLGLTSDGYVVCICEPTIFTHVRDPYKDPGLDENGTTPLYEPWRTSATGGQRNIVELVAVPPGEQAPDDVRVLKQQDLSNRIFVLYVELEPVELRSCFVTECDNKGQKVNVNLRALAVREQHLDEVEPCEGPLEFFRVPRLHQVKPLEDVRRASHIDLGYRTIVRQFVPRLAQKIRAAYVKYAEFLDLDDSHIDVVENSFVPAVRNTPPITQYHYGALKDLATAYNEFVEATCELVLRCCPSNDFPRHVMLGEFDPGPKKYRHRFYPSAVRNVIDDDFTRVRKLFLRISAIAKAVRFDNASNVRLTPSHWEGVSLGERAIPYYLDQNQVEEYWQPKMCCTNDKLWSYQDHPGAHAGPHDHENDTSDLGFNDYNRSSLLRIEGHLHDASSTAHQSILAERHLHNAEFDVLLTSFEDTSPQLDAVANLLLTLLAERQKVADAYNLLTARGVANRGFPQAALRAARQEIEEIEDRILREATKWVTLRGRRQLHCDISHLETMYIDLRAELLCLLGGLVVELDKVCDEIRSFGDKLPHKRGELALEILDLLKQQIGWLSDVWLPRRPMAFNYTIFAHRYKGMVHDVTRFWLMWRSFGFPVREAEEELKIPTPWPPGGEAISDVLLGILRGCFHTRFARLFIAFKKLWENDPSFFPNLVKMVDGLEHIAGVRRCGTFVVVCDRAATNQPLRVHADFSLSCRLPCCCDTEVDLLCLPPAALAGHRVVSLEEDPNGRLEPVDIEISLNNAGYEPNFEFEEGDTEEPPLRVKIEPAEFETELEGKVTFDEAKQIVRYVNRSPLPGLIDTFDYTLVSTHDRCPGEDVGKFSILMEPKPKPEPPVAPPEPVEKPGVVCGNVTYQGKPFARLGAVVSITPLDEAGEGSNVPVGPTAQSEAFYKKKLPAGRYELRAGFVGSFGHLSAFRNSIIGDPVQVNVPAGGKIEQDLELVPDERKGKVEILVKDRDKAIPTGTHVILRGIDVEFSGSSDESGGDPEKPEWHIIRDVPPGSYAAIVSADGFYTREVTDIFVAPGDGAAKVIEVEPEGHTVDDRFLVEISVAAGERLDEIREKTGDLYQKRYDEKRESVIKAGKENDAVRESKSYKRASRFLTDVLTNRDVPLDTVTRAYRKAAGGLTLSIRRSPTEPDKQEGMRTVLKEISSAYLDRVSIEQPLGRTPVVDEAVEGVLKFFNANSGATAAELITTHNSRELFNVGRVPIGRVLPVMMQ